MRGLLPDEVLAPRRFTTGVIVRQFTAAMRTRYPELLTSVLEAPALGELGLIQPDVLRRCHREYLGHGDEDVALALFSTLHAELWLQARLRARDALPEMPGDTTVVAGECIGSQ